MTARDDAVKAAAEAVNRRIRARTQDDLALDVAEAAVAAAAPILLAAERQRANEAARLSAEAVTRAEDAERRWQDHQDVCVMASLDREQLETRLAALVADLRALCDEWDAGGDDWTPVVVRAVIDRHAPKETP